MQGDPLSMPPSFLSFVDGSCVTSASRVKRKWSMVLRFNLHPHMIELFPSKVEIKERDSHPEDAKQY